jgi:hypothetical protein
MSGRLLPLYSNLLLHSTNQHHYLQPPTYCLPYVRPPKISNHYTFTLKMATAVLIKTQDKFSTSDTAYTLKDKVIHSTPAVET